MTSPAVLRSVCLVAWLALLPSSLGFQLPNDSRRPVATPDAVTRRRPLPLLVTGHRSARGLALSGIFGKHDFSTKDDKKDDDNDDDDDDETKDEKADDEAVVTFSSDPETTVAVPTVVTTTVDTSDDAVAAAANTTKSLLVLLNEIGNNFKAMAQTATAKGTASETQSKKILFAAKACVYYTLFILYRTYRGLFVLLPATFLQVYRKMEAVMDSGNLSLEEAGYTESGEDAVSTKSKWRTKLTVSILTTVVTASYIVGGVLKMASRFFRTIAKTSDVPKSFEAAADEVMNFEGRISRVGKVNGAPDEKISGSGGSSSSSASSGLAP